MYAWLKVNTNNFIEHVSCKKFIYEEYEYDFLLVPYRPKLTNFIKKLVEVI